MTIYIFSQNSCIINSDGEIIEDHSFYTLRNKNTRIVEEEPSEFYKKLEKHYDGLAKKIIGALDIKKETISIEDMTIKMVIPAGLKQYNEIKYSKGKICYVMRTPLNFIDVCILKGEAKRFKKLDN